MSEKTFFYSCVLAVTLLFAWGLKSQKTWIEKSTGHKVGMVNYIVNYRQLKIDAMVKDNQRISAAARLKR